MTPCWLSPEIFTSVVAVDGGGVGGLAAATAVKVTPSSIPVADTETVFDPTLAPRVRVLDARPSVLVVVLVVLSVPPPVVTENVTNIPESAEPFSSCTSTTNGFPNAVLMTPCWLSPEIFTNVVGDGRVSTVTAVKVTPSSIPVADTETVFDPTLAPRVRVLDALPSVLVVVLVVLSVPPPVVTENVTPIPESGEPFSSCTSTTNGFAKAVLMTPCWLSPEIFANVVAVDGGGVGGLAAATAVKVTPSSIPVADTETVFDPTLAPRVRVLDARPSVLVVVLVVLSVPPPVLRKT